MAQQRTFVQLQHYIRGNAIPDYNYVANNILTQAEVELLDMVALHHMPNDMQAGLAPIQVEGDGNCFPRTVSYLLFKTENRYPEICVRITYEAVLNMAMYLDDNYVSNGHTISMIAVLCQNSMPNIQIITIHMLHLIWRDCTKKKSLKFAKIVHTWEYGKYFK